MSATLTAPNDLDAMLAEIDSAPDPVKKNSKKAPVPCFRVTALEKLCNELPLKLATFKSLETEIKGDKKDIIDAAKPLQHSASKKIGFHVGTIGMNSLQVQCRNFHHTKKISDKKQIHGLSAALGDRMKDFFRVIRIIPETPEIVAALAAAGIKYPLYIAPLKALQETMSYDDNLSAIIAGIVPDLEPIWAVVAGKDA